jgi:hypothetical protein
MTYGQIITIGQFFVKKKLIGMISCGGLTSIFSKVIITGTLAVVINLSPDVDVVFELDTRLSFL